MWRTALKPRWLMLLALVVAVMASFTLLGLWQLDVARDRGRAEAVQAAPARPIAELATVVKPHAAFPADGSGRRITATGRYDGSGQVLVTGRKLRGELGLWVVTPFVVDSTGARLAVVRGFVTSAAAATAPRDGTLVVVGTLAPGESPADPGSPAAAAGARDAEPLAKGQLASLDLSVLVNQWPGEIYNAFVFATSEQPDATARSAIVRVPPPPAAGPSALSWRNAAYALQWWVFALFAAYMWWRMVRDDAQLDRRVRPPQRQEEIAHV